jgi:hypothetical protein
MKLRNAFSVLSVILLALLTCLPALADVIWEPNDDFYNKHRDACTYENRSYTAAGADGAVTLRREPGSKKAVATVKNGGVLRVGFTYTDANNVKWGVVEASLDKAGNVMADYSGQRVTGWTRMSDLSLVYDYISFAEEHQNEFKPYEGSYEEFKAVDNVVFWTYPGSGVTVGSPRELEDNFKLSDTYTDADGRLWGFVPYYYGIKNVWVCISDPSGAELKVTTSPAVTPSPAVTEAPFHSQPVVLTNPAPLILVIGIVAAVVILTGVLIAVFWKKNSKTNITK